MATSSSLYSSYTITFCQTKGEHICHDIKPGSIYLDIIFKYSYNKQLIIIIL